MFKITSGKIRVYAGVPSSAGYNGDGIAATTARMSNPSGLSVDSVGNLLVSEVGNHRVRLVRGVDAKIFTVAGNGKTSSYIGCSYDGMAATTPVLSQPLGVAWDKFGRFYVSDRACSIVFRVGTDGIIDIIAGVGSAGLSGDGSQASNAQLRYPLGLTLDNNNNNLYINDEFNYRIRKVDLDTGLISSTGVVYASGYISPHFGLDACANIYFGLKSGLNSGTVMKYDGSSSVVVGGGGTSDYSPINYWATSVMLRMQFIDWAGGVASDSAGNIYVVDSYNYEVLKISRTGSCVPQLYNPTASPSNVASRPTPFPTLVYTTPTAQPTLGLAMVVQYTSTSHVYNPVGVAMHPSGEVFYVDSRLCVIRTIDSTWLQSGVLPLQDTSGLNVVVGTWNRCGQPVLGSPIATSTMIDEPEAIAFDPNASGSIQTLFYYP